MTKKPARKKKAVQKKEDDRPFLEDGGQYGVSKAGFRRMPKAQKRELMIEWFQQNFEDPAERTPYESREGGYQWIWGGPYDARDQLEGKFGGLVPESLIDEVVDEVQKDGLYDWAPTASRDDYDEEPPIEEPLSLDIFLDERSPQYGTAEEREVRDRARTALDELGAALDKPLPIGIGHNRPPEDERVPVEISELRISVFELRVELTKPEPEIPTVKRWTHVLRDAAIASGKWLARKVDTAVDTAVKVAVTAAVVAVGTQFSEPLTKALNAVIEWLMMAARTVF